MVYIYKLIANTVNLEISKQSTIRNEVSLTTFISYHMFFV
jgi:hypothetical protein